jgi:DNA-binding transcriptional LysR family regulator
MGVRQFNRSTRSVVLSAAGEQFVASVGPALQAIRSAVEHVDEHWAEATGTFWINTSVGAPRMILTPLILEYMRRNPQMAVEIVTEGALVDVNAKGFDAGIRIREAVPPDMVVVPMGDSIRPAIVGSRDYFRRHGKPQVQADLQDHLCIRV